MVKTLAFLLTVAVLIVHEDTLNWEGTGNMSIENMTVIKSYINANLTLTWTSNQLKSITTFLLTDFSQAFSKELNRRWDEAWNVFAIYHTDKNNYDAVVYGYAFRDHWHWYNGIKFNDGYYASIILWKDYNCKQWRSFAQSRGDLTYSYAISDIFYALISVLTNQIPKNVAGTNIWQAVYNLGKVFETDSTTKDYAFTLVGIATQNSQTNGYFCGKDYFLYNALGSGSNVNWGKTFVIQTR